MVKLLSFGPKISQMEPVYSPDQPKAAVSPRPVFLTILCIATFLGSTYTLFKGVQSFFFSNVASDVISTSREIAKEELKNKPHGEQAGKLFDSFTSGFTAENLQAMGIVMMISGLITLAAALLMWNRRKIGFYLYILGILALLIPPFIIFKGTLIGGFMSMFEGFFGVIFCVLYGLNLKHMK